MDESVDNQPKGNEQEITPQEEEKAIRAIIASPVKFCKAVLGLNPFLYQERFLEDKSNRIIACAGRQVGKSLITSARALWFGISHPETTTLIVSATQRQSSLMFDKILKFVEHSTLISGSVVRKTRTQLNFTNQSQIVALPCGPHGDSLRGHTAHQIIVDEAAFVPEEVITQVAMPMLSTTNGTAILISTPLDREHYFYRAFTSPTWSKYQFKTGDNPLVSKEFLEAQRLEAGERKFRQEYLAEFVDEESTYFPNSLLRSCLHVCAGVAPCPYCEVIRGMKEPSGSLYAGYDPGGLSDPATLVVVERFNDQEKRGLSYRVVMAKVFVAAKLGKTGGDVYTQFTAQVADLHKKFHFRKVFVDSTGLGSPIVEHCKSLGLPAEGIIFSSKTKEDMLSHLRILLEQKRVMLPDNLDLLSNLNCIVAERTHSGGYSFSHANGTHDDLGYALALAAWAARNGGVVMINRGLDNDSGNGISWREQGGKPQEWT
ncbi:MAG: terminase large subunit domain-containing protein [Nitrososphaerales archaeon]